MRADIARLVESAAEAAVLAGRPLAERFHDGVAAVPKPGTHAHDVVTAADARAEAVIRAALTDAWPGSTVIGEESGDGREGDPDGVRWIVDPIDGTANFARGVPLFCVSIGVRLPDGTAGGCVYDPVRDESFTGTPDGLRLNGRPVPAGRPRHAVPLALTDVPRPGVAPDPSELALFASLIQAADVRRIGSSALALAYVACGRADVAAGADAFVWDTAAGSALVAASGGGFAGVPEPSADRPGGFAAWTSEAAALGERVARALEAAHHEAEGHG
ncbi:inositol monophosphatase family protein [Spirillospora sp. CA-294931]|uniref:inositol monophosphatase family protein n=1 Tax=Spirillospora sp. CA-294931 TaxID=3240042 RepID=UPI003D8FC4BF